MNDNLGDRIKSNYEDRTRYFLPRRTHTILRLDGRAFHTYTRGYTKPFDTVLMERFNISTTALISEIQGAKFAYLQSDEINILITDFDKIATNAWFDGNIQKICSVAASLLTSEFNKYGLNDNLANFDARVFTIPDRIEVLNYFIWRQKDWERNSIQMYARSFYSHKELENKSCSNIHEMLHQKGANWADLQDELKNGRLITKDILLGWQMEPAFIFHKDQQKFLKMIPEPVYE